MQYGEYVIACEQVAWKFQCPQRWEDLSATDNECVRYCAQCRRDVYLARNPAELNDLARQGVCVAWCGDPSTGVDSEDSMVIGEVGRDALFYIESNE